MNQTNKHLLSDRFTEALIYATRLHNNQVRKGSNVPYISHLLSVTALVLEDGGSEDEAIAALLHDAIEDQGGDKTRQEIKAKFGEKVAVIVEGCTESDATPKPPWKERKLATIKKLHHASSEVRRVILADKVHNARSILTDWYRIGDVVWDKFKAGKAGTIWYFSSIAEVDRELGSTYLGEELTRVTAQLRKTET